MKNTKKKLTLAKITKRLIGQPMFHLLAKAREIEKMGKEVIHFEIGDPSFNSPGHVIEAAKNALNQNLTHYTNSMGIVELREAVMEFTRSQWGFTPLLEQILICPANAIIDFVVRCLVNPGEEVIYPDPGFPTYYAVLNYNCITPVGIKLREENEFRIDPDEIESRITRKTRLIIINTPQNPTGSVMTESDVIKIAWLAEKYKLYLLSDEVYARIIFNKKHFSPAVIDKCRERTIILNSLSKTYAMSGWRLGYAVGPVELIEKMGLLLQTIISCLPAFTQHAGITAILGDQKIVKDRCDELDKRRNLLVSGLNSLPGVSCVMPQGAFYAFPNVSGTGMSGDEFSDIMLKKAGVCVLPGSCFGKYGKDYIRLCYASTEISEIEKALLKMNQVMKREHYD